MKLFVFQFCTFQIKEKNICIGEEEIRIRILFVPDLDKLEISLFNLPVFCSIYTFATFAKDFDDENLQVFRIDGNDRKLYRGEIPRNK